MDGTKMESPGLVGKNRAIGVRTLQVTGLRNQGENSHGHRICLVSNCWPEAPT